MLLIYNAPGSEPGSTPAEEEAEMGKWFTYTEALAKAGALLAGDPLQGVEVATSVRVRNSKRLVTDGPFAETKEQLSGYYMIECADLDAALEWASQVPAAFYGTIEVRPVMEMSGM